MDRIDMMYAFIAEDDDGEGIVSFRAGLVEMPMVGADLSRVASLTPLAQQIADKTGKTITLAHFSVRVDVDRLLPLTEED